MKETWVVAKTNPVPREDFQATRKCIDKEPVLIPLTTYYQRRMLDDELVEVSAPQPAAATAAPKAATITTQAPPAPGGK